MKNDHPTKAAESSEINQWDAGMRASMEICLADYWGSLKFICGYEINKRPNEADMVIVKKTDADRLDDIVAEFFNDINVIEFKSLFKSGLPPRRARHASAPPRRAALK